MSRGVGRRCRPKVRRTILWRRFAPRIPAWGGIAFAHAVWRHFGRPDAPFSLVSTPPTPAAPPPRAASPPPPGAGRFAPRPPLARRARRDLPVERGPAPPAPLLHPPRAPFRRRGPRLGPVRRLLRRLRRGELPRPRLPPPLALLGRAPARGL